METLVENKQTVYIVRDEKSKLFILQYAPNQSYAGRKDSDQYSLAQGLKCEGLNHDFLVGSKIQCRLVYHTPSGLQSIGKEVTVIAKQCFDWNMSKPIGERKGNEKKTGNWNLVFANYQKQPK